MIRNIKRNRETSDELFVPSHTIQALANTWNFIHNYTLWTKTTGVACQYVAGPLIITAFLQGFSGFILHQWCHHCKRSKFTNRSRRRAGAGSNLLHGCGGEDGGSSCVVGRCVQLWQVDEVESGRGDVLHLRHWKAMEIWHTPQIWIKEGDVAVNFCASSCSLPMYL